MEHDVKDLSLADAGKARIEWADRDMPVLASIRERFEVEKPLDGVRISACLHVTTETANLMRTLKAGGAEIVLAASNPLSTQDDVAAALVEHYGIRTYAIKGEDTETYYTHIDAAIEFKPQMTMDDGADVVGRIHADFPEALEHIIGGTEETTTGVIRLKAMAADGALKYPIVAVNDADTKHLFDNRYGTGQSTLDGVIRATNRLIAGRTVVVSGYGNCGRGIAERAEGHGANVIVLEVDPLRALEAVMDGYRVMPAVEAAAHCDIWITVTGDLNVIDVDSFAAMKDGAIICNSGHFNAEINIPRLREMSVSSREVRPLVEEFTFADGRTICLLADGRLVNLSCAEGHPASVMDMSFANQALCAEYMMANAASLEPGVYGVPVDIDKGISKLKLETLGVKIDTLTAEQEKYLASWEEGTC
ncbi:MAG: adenosylhomocysteinase [Actinobacteria bacterium HGW-Actinobacteria-7]|nr:MAG: adenosylhomocysteinase [Actinobacteria bacterium HGW-Actinobacteria-7]